MGYVKLEKAADAFDLLPAENVAMVKLDSANIVVTYLGTATLNITIVGASSYTQADVQAVINAIDVINGHAGASHAANLSSLVASSTYA
jgi:hypothetical protein